MTKVISTNTAFQLSITSGSCQLTIFVLVERIEMLALKVPNVFNAQVAAEGRKTV